MDRAVSAFPRGVYICAVALLFFAAAWVRFQLPRWPCADADTWGYLHPAISKLAGGPFQHTNTRNLVYPTFLLLVIAPARNLSAITFAHHLAGLAAGGLLLACWHQVARFVRVIPRGIYFAAGLVLAASFLFARTPLLFEQYIRPEAITPFVSLLNILFTLKFLEHRANGQRAAVLALFVLLNSLLLATLKIAFVFCAIFSVALVLFALFRRPGERLRNLPIIALPLLLALCYAAFEHHAAKQDRATEQLLPTTLFVIHANSILAEMDDAIARGDCAPYDCSWLATVSASAHRGINASRRLGKMGQTLQFDPDYLFYRDPEFKDWTTRFFAGDDRKRLDFFNHWYWRTLRRHPGLIVRKILDQLAVFYAPWNPSFSTKPASIVGAQYRTTVNSLAAHDAQAPPTAWWRDYIEAATILTTRTDSVAQPWIITLLNLLLAFVYLPILLCVVMISLLLLCWPEQRALYGTFAAISLFIFSYNLEHTLLTAVVHTMDNLRYSSMQLSMSLLAVFVGGAFLAEVGFGNFIETLRARRRT